MNINILSIPSYAVVELAQAAAAAAAAVVVELEFLTKNRFC
jgi:hypothetical protein